MLIVCDALRPDFFNQDIPLTPFVDSLIQSKKFFFTSEEDKWTFLRRLNSRKPKGVFGKLDLTQEERKVEKVFGGKVFRGFWSDVSVLW